MDVTLFVALLSIAIGYVPYLLVWAWKRNQPVRLSLFTLGLIASVVSLALIGFAIGFFGPIVLTPSANQGPLLGIFITGPAGAIIGMLGYTLYALTKAVRQPNQQPKPTPYRRGLP